MGKRYFEDIKEGDHIWTMELGDAKVTDADSPINAWFAAANESGMVREYNLDGKRNEHDLMQTAFWQNPNITIPPKPKKKIPVQYVAFCSGPFESTHEGEICREMFGYAYRNDGRKIIRPVGTVGLNRVFITIDEEVDE